MNDIDPWAASDGLPEVADEDSYADGELESARDPDDPWALPPDREDGPLALDEWGTTAAEAWRGEPLDDRLAREVPDVWTLYDADRSRPYGSDARPSERDRHPIDRGDPDERADPVSEPEADLEPRLDSPVSLYDRQLPGLPGEISLGALVRPGSGYGSAETDEIAFDLGAGLGGLSGEELAMHEIPPEQMDREEAESTSEPYVLRLGPVIRTGAEQPWDPEDLAVAEGRDPTPANVERARRELEELGPAAIEKTVP
jgi:hypothetical protein